VPEGVLVEVGLQVLGRHRAGVSTQKPALRERDRPVTTLDGVTSRSSDELQQLG
jgi:hypothetical protein